MAQQISARAIVRWSALAGTVLLWLCTITAGPAVAAGPVIEDTPATGLALVVSDDRIRWGEEFEVTVKAVNTTGQRLPGGMYLSFDGDVLVLAVKGGSILQPGTAAFDLKTTTSQPLKQPMVEAWEADWKPGIERQMVVTVLPLSGQNLRLLARATFIAASAPPRVHIAPGRFESRSLDERGFPSRVAYVAVLRSGTLRRSIRRLESRIRQMSEANQRQLANALAVELTNPNGFLDLTGKVNDASSRDAATALKPFLTRAAEQLKSDPLVALENLRCLMASLDCRRAAVYFGVPIAVYADLSREQVARMGAKNRIETERGGAELIGLLDAEGYTYRLDEQSGDILVQIDNRTLAVRPNGVIMPSLLDQLVDALGSKASKKQVEVNGLSFVELRARLGGSPAGKPVP